MSLSGWCGKSVGLENESRATRKYKGNKGKKVEFKEE
jgi:hypothetical protein